MNETLPFYYFTLNDRYKEEDPSFDEKPAYDEKEIHERNHPLRLQRLRVNRREDCSIFVCAQSVLPARHGKKYVKVFTNQKITCHLLLIRRPLLQMMEIKGGGGVYICPGKNNWCIRMSDGL